MKKVILVTAITAALWLQAWDLSAQDTLVHGNNLRIGLGNNIESNHQGFYIGNAIGLNNYVKAYYSIAIGTSDTINYSSPNSIALGSSNAITGGVSMAFGRQVKVVGEDNIGIGNNIRVTSARSGIVIGSGINGSGGAYLVNSTSNSLMVGFNSARPTLFVSASPNSLGSTTKTGKVAIGDVTPQAKLHIRSDQSEDAGIIIVPAEPDNNNTFIRMRDNAHQIIVNDKGVMEVSAGIHFPLCFTSSNINASGNMIEIGNTDNRTLILSSESNPAISSNAYPRTGGYARNVNGPSYLMEFGSNGFLFRTATYADPRYQLITNWRNAFSVKTNGAITLTGKIGINIENNTLDYALAVDGGIIATEVYVMDVGNWPDYVFDINYKLMPLSELKQFITKHHHLPDIPSEKETEEKGCDLGEIQKQLLIKIEELTLYIIQQEERISQLEKEQKTHQW